LLLVRPSAALILSAALYIVAKRFNWNLPAYPTSTWFFNPLTWQLIFVVGAWCSVSASDRMHALLRSRTVVSVAIGYLAIAFLVVLTWYIPRAAALIPKVVQDWMYPIDKNNLDILRFLHFAALAIVTVRFVPIDWPGLKSAWLRPMILCGQHSLEIFCLGIFLSFIGYFVTSEISRSVPMQILISVLGIFVMIAIALLITWYNDVEGRGSGKGRKPQADLAGGEA
jgi:hypothetical protein